MSKKVYVIDSEGFYYECPCVGKTYDIEWSRNVLALVADELRELGNKADIQRVYNNLVSGYWLMPDAHTEITDGQIYSAFRYVEDCQKRNVAVYWPYVLNRVLDFLECEHYTSENY